MYFQKGAGELVGICWLGRCAVLGGASLGWRRCGAGVTKEPPSSGRYEEDSTGGDWVLSANALVCCMRLLIRGSGLSSWRCVVNILRTGVTWGWANDIRGGGEVAGEIALRLRIEPGSLRAISLGPEVI